MGMTEEGREMLLVAISDEANIEKLDHYKEINAQLADPRKTTAAEAEKLIAEAQADVLGLRQHPLAGNRLAGNADGTGLSPGGGRFAVHPEHPQEHASC